MKKRMYNICVDLNGVLDLYSGWRGEGHTDPPRPGACKFLQVLSRDYQVTVFTTKPSHQVWEWLRKYGMDEYVSEVTDRKIPAVAYVDDRAICFRGNFDETLREIKKFRPFWKE